MRHAALNLMLNARKEDAQNEAENTIAPIRFQIKNQPLYQLRHGRVCPQEIIILPQSGYLPGCCGVAAGKLRGGAGAGMDVGFPLWIMLSPPFAADAVGRKKMFATRHNPMNKDARIVVVLPKKSAVRRTPKTVPTVPPPNEPASPPPLLDCISTTIISRIDTNISIKTRKLNIFVLLVYFFEESR